MADNPVTFSTYPVISGSTDSDFLWYPTGDTVNFLIYCKPASAITPPTNLNDVINQFEESSIATIQFYFLKNAINSGDYKNALGEIQNLQDKDKDFIIWIDNANGGNTIISDSIYQNSVKLTLGFQKPASQLPGSQGHITLPDINTQPLFPFDTNNSASQNLYISQDSSSTEPFRIESASLSEAGSYDSLQIKFAGTTAYVSLNSGTAPNSTTILTFTNQSGASNFSTVFYVPIVNTSWDSKNMAPGTFYLYSKGNIAINSSQAAPCFSYSLLVGSEAKSATKFDSSALYYPLLADYSVLNTKSSPDLKSGDICINPLTPSSSYIDVNISGTLTPYTTHFRTTIDEVVELTPVQEHITHNSIRFNFNHSYEGYYYLTPAGSYTMSVSGGGKGTNQLLCGLSGTEFIEFSENDIISFYPNQNASVEVSLASDFPDHKATGHDKYHLAFKFSNDAGYSTAWATIKSANSGCTYSTQADGSPLFYNKNATDLNDLDYFSNGSSKQTLPASPSDADAFPIVPYSGVAKGSTSISANPQAIESLEFQLLSPKRKNIIAGQSTPTYQTNTNNVYTLTPQGYRATFNKDGKLTQLKIANRGKSGDEDYVNINFTASTGESLDKLYAALLANQQFLVITTSGNTGTFVGSVTMDGWPFTIDLPTKTTVGNYSNVLIFKSGGATISQMAKDPTAWAQYSDFNDATHDPDGNYLSSWLVNYLDEAKALYKNGSGVKSLKNFCEIIDDPNWNGFLALKVNIEQQGLPVVIQALAADIKPGLFNGHHIGIETNHAATPSAAGKPYTLKSFPFGLVLYIDPTMGENVNNLPPYIQSNNPYDFIVLTIQALFKKCHLEYFSSKCVLIMKNILGDTVSNTAENGTNNLVIIGTEHKANGVISYSFTTGKGVVNNFYLESNAFKSNQVTRASMTVVKTTTPSIYYTAKIGLEGNFEFLDNKNFDLLSYQRLAYHGLTMNVTIQSGKPNHYTLDSSGLVLSQNQNHLYEEGEEADPAFNQVRKNSLVSQFPLKLKSFINGSGDYLPEAMGYRLLNTDMPSGISLAGPASGKPWYALEFDMNLGGQGFLGTSSNISASFLLAWSSGGSGNKANASPQFKLSGPGGVSLSFDFEGVIKFGARDIVLNYQAPPGDPGQFALIFESIALTILDISVPPKGSTNMVLLGDTSGDIVKPTLSWFGGYQNG